MTSGDGETGVRKNGDGDDSIEPPTAAESLDDEATDVGLDTLRPEFREAEHAIYLRYLTEALDAPAKEAAQNIALTGGYGVGKSSVLRQYVEENPNRVVTVSLSTISPEDGRLRSGTAQADGSRPVKTEGNGAKPRPEEDSVSGEIQKSIVKQLLYSEAPGRTPGSRFNRIDEFRPRRAIGIATVLAVPIAVAGYLADVLARPEAFVRWNPLGVVSIWILAFVGVVAVLTLIQKLIHFRFRLERFTAGPATIALSGTDQTYFDRYLDEIVYYFQQTKFDVVIFEDLDRFNDAEIFEQLRELNTVLNSAKQIAKRPIRFVYAVRDSLFETAPDAAAFPLETSAEKDVAGDAPSSIRVKFFDLIIPMVPFATHRTSRDLLRRAFRLEGAELAHSMERLVATAAPFLQDMRVISNIGNEYRIFAEHVLNPSIDGLRPESLGAMVIYKNLYLADYERIRAGASRLDEVERKSRDFVRSAISAIDSRIGEIDAELADASPTAGRADRVANSLENFIQAAAGLFQGGAPIQFILGGEPFTSAQIRTPEFWASYVEGDVDLVARVNGITDYSMPRATLESIVGSPLSPDQWKESDLGPGRAERGRLLLERQHHLAATLSQLTTSGRTFVWKDADGVDQTTSFGKYVSDYLGDGAAFELIRAGFIDRYFSLYVSRYIGETTSASALNFAMKYVQLGEQNFDYVLGPKDIDGLIAEVGDVLFRTRSAFNIDLVAALIKDQRFAPILDLLAEGDENARRFIDAYSSSVAKGIDTGALISKLASRWPGLLVHLAGWEDVDRSVTAIDRALGTPGQVRFESDMNVRERIESHYAQMNAFAGEGQPGTPTERAMRIAGLGVSVSDLQVIPAPLRAALGEKAAFAVTSNNLRAVTNGSISLEAIVHNSDVFTHVVRNATEYVSAVLEVAETTVSDPARFASTLSMVATIDDSAVAPIAGAAAPGLLVRDIGDLAQAGWRGAMGQGRIAMTVSNLSGYIAQYGLDQNALVAITAEPTLTVQPDSDSDEARMALADTIVNSVKLSVQARINSIKSLQLSTPLRVSRIDLQEGDLLPSLVAATLIPDTADTFGRLSPMSWETREQFIQRSGAFAEYLVDLPLSAGEISAILASALVPLKVKHRLVENLATFGSILTPQSARDVIDFAVDQRLTFSLTSLRLLAAALPGERQLLTVVAIAQGELDQSGLYELLRSAGGDSASLIELGARPLYIPEVPLLIPMLERLRADGLVSSWSEPEDGSRRINMHR